MLGDTWGAETSPSGAAGAFANAAETVQPGMGQTVLDYIRQGASVADALTGAVTHYRMTRDQLEASRELADNARRGIVPVAPERTFLGIPSHVMPYVLLAGAGLATLYFFKGRKGR